MKKPEGKYAWTVTVGEKIKSALAEEAAQATQQSSRSGFPYGGRP